MGGAVEPRPIASLSSGLLARKGQAKPAMRPQGFGGFGAMTMGHEDLGWNDMGYDADGADEATPAPRPFDPEAFLEEPPPPPVIHAQLHSLAVEYGDEEASTAPILSVKPRDRTKVPAQIIERDPTPAVAGGKKAAFTLRLDADRHLKLRLASAVGNRSAQQLVTEALDRFFDTLPGLDVLAGRPATSAE